MQVEELKYCLVGIVAISQVFALWGGNVPYFPIELSRAIASNKLGLYSFRLGISLLAFGLDSPPLLPKIVLWIGLMLVAWLPDTDNFIGHMTGVALLLLATILRAAMNPERKLINALLIVSALGIYALRLVLKIGILYYFVNNRTDLRTYVHMAQAIMFDGPESVPKNVAAEVIPIFQLGGILQWVALYILSLVF